MKSVQWVIAVTSRELEDEFNQCFHRNGLPLVVTSLGAFSPLVVPALARFQRAHPDVVTRFLTGERLFRLEYGEAHVAIRAG